MVSKDSFILDAATLRSIYEPETRRVTFPQALERGGLVRPEEAIYWAVDPDTAGVVISRDQDWLKDRFDVVDSSMVDRFDVVDSSMVTSQRVATIPHTLFQDWDIDDDDHVFFVASNEELVNETCRIMTEDDMLDAFPQEIVDTFKPD